MPRDQVDERYLETPYYIAPDDKVAQEAFAVIRDAMREKGRAGVGRVVIARRERMVLLEPLGKGILATLLRYPYEVRGEEAYFEDIPDLKLPAEMRDLAGHIIETKAADFDPTKFEDRYENAVDRAHPVEADRKGARGHRGAAAIQRREPDGCAAPQHRSRGSRRRPKKAALEERDRAHRAHRAARSPRRRRGARGTRKAG